jgi:hypothetical protein
MSEDQKKNEVKRPERKRLEEFAFHNRYIPPQPQPMAPK